ncbi:MAG: tRNA pseudouridine(55) synthase TruB [Marinilabiliales bacterium]
MSIYFLDEKNFESGAILLINKNKGEYSFTALKKVRYIIQKHTGIKKLKTGHAGTLDPMATGLLIICTGKATKKISEIQSLEKEYIAEIKLGETTPSLDAETKVSETFSIDHIKENDIINVLNNFKGKITQLPPEYSALKINGVRAYKKARKGDKIEMKPREVHIHNIELLETNLPYIKIRVICSKGTYIRSLARDIGKELNSGAYLTDLIRTRTGQYSIENSVYTKNFEEKIINLLKRQY